MSSDRKGQLTRRQFVSSAIKMAAGVGFFSAMRDVGMAVNSTNEESQISFSGPVDKGRTGFLYSPEYLRHTLGKGHPESPERLKAIIARISESGLNKELTGLTPSVDPLPYIKLLHTEAHIKQVDSQASDPSICRLAVSGALSAVDAVFAGKVKNAFCAVRPPGHHAENAGEFGFCFYGNVAVAAKYALEKYKISRVLVVDWDYHHGNGTERAFYSDPAVMFFSTHRLEAFPRTGFPERRGEGKKEGLNINVPMPAGADDEQFIKAFNEKLLPVADKFKPELVLVSAGFDAMKNDTLGDFAVSDAGFAKLTEIVMGIAARHSSSRLVSVLEGGYNVKGLATAVETHVRTLLSVKAG